MKIIGRHKWVEGAMITESYDENDDRIRSFTATIRGFRNWHIYRGWATKEATKVVIAIVKHIRDRIDTGDEQVFYQKNEFATDLREAQELVTVRPLELDSK